MCGVLSRLARHALRKSLSVFIPGMPHPSRVYIPRMPHPSCVYLPGIPHPSVQHESRIMRSTPANSRHREPSAYIRMVCEPTRAIVTVSFRALGETNTRYSIEQHCLYRPSLTTHGPYRLPPPHPEEEKKKEKDPTIHEQRTRTPPKMLISA